MAEGPGFIQSRAEEAEGRPHGSCSSSQRAEGQCHPLRTAIEPEGTAEEGQWAWNSSPGQWAQPQAVQGVFEQHSQTQGLDFGWSMQSQELDSTIPAGPLQLGIIYDSIL